MDVQVCCAAQQDWWPARGRVFIWASARVVGLYVCAPNAQMCEGSQASDARLGSQGLLGVS
jgi:hypothetical protein